MLLCDLAGTRTQDPPDKIGMLCQLSYTNNPSIYFLDFIFLIANSRFLASCKVAKVSVCFNIQGIPVEVNFEWPILCSYNRRSKSVHAPI